jgi:hypothetical protein
MGLPDAAQCPSVGFSDSSNRLNSCRFQPWCPSFGGNPELAAIEAPARLAVTAAA